MHRSKFAGLIIDCETEDLDSAAGFWGAALGYERDDQEEDGIYAGLSAPDTWPYIEVQKVDHASRVHLDIEADDLEAEAARLEALGAQIVSTVKTWIVMEAPTGQRFCIVPPVSKDFVEQANQWP
jgi:predicted enzyme related to lactoylglutathione lyase